MLGTRYICRIISNSLLNSGTKISNSTVPVTSSILNSEQRRDISTTDPCLRRLRKPYGPRRVDSKHKIEPRKPDPVERPDLDHPDMPDLNMKNPYEKPVKKCIICEHNVELDYKNTRLLSQFVSRHTGRIYGRHITGLCVYMQRRMARLIKRARFHGYMPYVNKDPRFWEDPELYQPFKK